MPPAIKKKIKTKNSKPGGYKYFEAKVLFVTPYSTAANASSICGLGRCEKPHVLITPVTPSKAFFAVCSMSSSGGSSRIIVSVFDIAPRSPSLSKLNYSCLGRQCSFYCWHSFKYPGSNIDVIYTSFCEVPLWCFDATWSRFKKISTINPMGQKECQYRCLVLYHCTAQSFIFLLPTYRRRRIYVSYTVEVDDAPTDLPSDLCNTLLQKRGLPRNIPTLNGSFTSTRIHK